MSDNSNTIYLDHAATTPLDPSVFEKMVPFFSQFYGNPSGIHSVSRKALSALSDARRRVATLLNCSPDEIIFTSGGSESNNLAVKGLAFKGSAQNKNHLIISAIEHPAVTQTIEQLCQLHGFEKTLLPVDSKGKVNSYDLEKAIRPETALISVIYANNEVGTVQDIISLTTIAQKFGIPFHTDAVQAAGKLLLDIKTLQVDLLSLSGHKIYGPKGIGILYLKKGTSLQPLITGGNQEDHRRAGTENIPSVVGFSYALEKAQKNRENESARLKQLGSDLTDQLITKIKGIQILGEPDERVAGLLSFIIPDIEINRLLMHLDLAGICASSGSACATGNPEPSKVLLAMGVERERAVTAIRLSLGKSTQEAEIIKVTKILPEIVKKLRA